MFTITIVFGNVSAALMYRDKERAAATWLAIKNGGSTLLVDEFGREMYLPNGGAFYGAIFEDMTKAKQGTIETMLHQERTRAKAVQMASVDPELRAAQQGPAVLTPMGMNGGRAFS